MTRIPTVVRVVAIALFDHNGRVLLQKRRAEARHGGLWEFPGGKVERGESAESAMIREVAEELGVAVAPADLRAEGEVWDESDSDPRLVLNLYRCARWHGEPRCLDAQAIGWFTVAQAQALAVPPLDQPFIAGLAAIASSVVGGPA